MSKIFRKRSEKVGLPPGTIVHIGERKAQKHRITIVDYDETKFQERELETIEESFPFKDTSTITWINIDGLHQLEIIEKIGKHFNIHPLVLEDITNTEQRPKMEDFDDYLFLILKMICFEEKDNRIKVEQVGLILGSNFVISFQEKKGNVFDPVKQRIISGKGRIRTRGADYLAYALIDVIVDGYFLIIERIGDQIEDLEEDLLDGPRPETMQDIHSLKREMLQFRKSVWPLQEIIRRLERGESDMFNESTEIYLKDVHDHTIHVIDTIEIFNDMLSGLLDLYISSISNKINQIMKVLTIIATIFIPLTFIAGVYGMNFKYMPELDWRYGYPMVLLVMFIIGVGIMIYARKKRWL
ncbi:MAG: magnesium transporter [Candidatus Methanomarinus sp.]|nr:MAG: magnesium transporter [ANME-2 cluster archaeon]KAF5424829.1 magnesium transporter [ANME-2 cluster archaeon]